MSSLPSSAAEITRHGASDACLNCGARLAPEAKFCHACGQDTAHHPPSLFEFVHEFVAHYVALEGALWRSLKGLALRPGFLTLEYLAGRKMRYVLPLRLLLTLGFVFFLLVKITPDHVADQAEPFNLAAEIDEEGTAVPPVAASGAGSSGLSPSAELVPQAVLEHFPLFLRSKVEAADQRWRKDQSAEADRMMGKVRGLLPYAVLCSLPFFAGILALMFWWRRQTYGAHFVFAMHLHAFFYLGLTMLLIPLGSAELAVLGWIMLYPVLAIKRVYANSWWQALCSSAAVFFLHLLLLLLMFSAVFAIGALAP